MRLAWALVLTVVVSRPSLSEALTCSNNVAPYTPFDPFVCSVDSAAGTMTIDATNGSGGVFHYALLFDAGDLSRTWRVSMSLLNNGTSPIRTVGMELLVPDPEDPPFYTRPRLADDLVFCQPGTICEMDSDQLSAGQIFSMLSGTFEFQNLSIFSHAIYGDGGFECDVGTDTCTCKNGMGTSCLTPSFVVAGQDACCRLGPAKDVVYSGERLGLEYTIRSDSATDVRVRTFIQTCSLPPLPDPGEGVNCPEVGAWAWTHRP